MTFWNILAVLAAGAGITLLLSVACMAAALVVGLTAALLSRSRWMPVQHLLVGFTFLFRGIPVLVLLFIVFFGLPGLGVRVPPFLSVVLTLGLISGAYLAEIFRGAMNSVSREEILAAEAAGMTRTQGFLYILLPQMFRFSIPGMINEFTSILKYTPFAYTVGIPEIMKRAMSLTPVILRGLEVYLAAGIVYFLIYKACLLIFSTLEKKYRIPGLAAQ
ncbi:MAG: amino acid ABC transporter permease [Syntrophales bacterium]